MEGKEVREAFSQTNSVILVHEDEETLPSVPAPRSHQENHQTVDQCLTGVG